LDGLVGKAQHPIASLSQECFSLGVLIALREVHVAIKLNGQATIWTAEIDHERADRMLSAKLQSREAATA